MGARVLTLAAARRTLVHDAVRRLRAAYPAGTEGGGPPDVVQGVHIVGPDAAAVTTYARLTHEVGADAAGYALVRTRHNRPVVVDLGVWARRDGRNPLVRVWSVVARTSELLRTAAAFGVLPGRSGTLEGEREENTVRLAAALDAVTVAAREAAVRGEPHRLAERLEQVVPVHETVLGVTHSELSTVRDGRTGGGAAAYRARLSLLSRCARDVAEAVAALGAAAPERL